MRFGVDNFYSLKSRYESLSVLEVEHCLNNVSPLYAEGPNENQVLDPPLLSNGRLKSFIAMTAHLTEM